MTGSTPPRKRRFPLPGADSGPSDGPRARDDGRGSSDPGASLEPAADRGDLPAPADEPAPVGRRRAVAIRDKAVNLAREGARKGGSRARAGLAYLADRIIEIAPRVPVRDLGTLRRQFPDLGPEQLADKLVAGAAGATSA
ncbi:hypothetical protein AB0D38_36050, partial [Streptomyces sp. NPDC048279]